MTKQRGIKIAIICAVIVVLLVGASLLVYFNFFNKMSYHLVGVEITDCTVSDFTDQTELEFFQDGTFHLQIKHKEKGLLLTGIGTYVFENQTYQLNFIQAYARDTNNTVVDITEQCKDITCVRSGNRIKLMDHKSQIYYFG
ncbi:MAG: hypothetical protein NC133_00585 [Prevotella sp.]|nr:hypothetical protein [Prevotella sp.]